MKITYTTKIKNNGTNDYNVTGFFAGERKCEVVKYSIYDKKKDKKYEITSWLIPKNLTLDVTQCGLHDKNSNDVQLVKIGTNYDKKVEYEIVFPIEFIKSPAPKRCIVDRKGYDLYFADCFLSENLGRIEANAKYLDILKIALKKYKDALKNSYVWNMSNFEETDAKIRELAKEVRKAKKKEQKLIEKYIEKDLYRRRD